MAAKGWIKLYRQCLDNPVFNQDPTAWHIFEVLLLICDRSGKWSGGRFQLAHICRIKPVTLYKALQRLKLDKMVTLDSNNRFTTISICKWREYQGSGNNASNNQVTTEPIFGNTLTRIYKTRIEKGNDVNIAKTREQKAKIRRQLSM